MPRARKSGRPAHPKTRADIVALAAPVFAQRGVSGVSIREVAELAGVRKASLYHHFESKQQLYAAVMEDALGGLFSLIATAKLDEGDFAARLDRLGALIVETLAQRPDTARLLVHELVSGGPWLSGDGAAFVQQTLELTSAFLEAGMDAGVFVRCDARQLALSIAGLHLFPFASPEATGRFLGAELSAPAQVAARKAAVLAHVRRLCLA